MRVLLLFLVMTLVFLIAGFCDAAHEEKEPFSLNEVVVTSERIQEYIKNHPQEVTVMERKEIADRNLSTMEDVLKTMPGVEVHSASGIGSRISIRGSGKSGGVMVLLNGRPLNTNQYGNLDLNSIPVEIVESVMVFKPPVPVWLGPGGSEGAINIITRSQMSEDEKKKHHSTIKLSGGSFGLAEGGISRNFQLMDGDALVSAAMKHRDGKRANTDRNEGNFALNWNKEGEKGARYEISARYYISEYGMPGPLDNLTPDARQEYQKGSIDTRYSGIIGQKGTFSFNAYGDTTRLKDKSQAGYTVKLDDNKLGAKFDAAWSHEKGDWDMRLGGMLEWNDFDHTLSGKHHRIRSGINSQYDRRFGAITGTIGFRGDYTNDFKFNPGFSAGLGWGISEKCLIKARTGYSVNVPTFEQLYQTTHGSIDQTRGNPDLKEEKIWSHSLGMEYKFEKDRLLQIAFFRADTRDLISYKRGADKIYRPINIPSAERQGIEVTGKYGWVKDLVSELNIVLQDSKNNLTGKELSYTPKIRVKGSMQYTLPSLKTRMEASVRYEGRRYNQIENLPSQQLNSYTTVDMKVIQPLKLKGASAEWYLKVDNLFNASYESHFGYPDDGRRFTTGMQVRF